MDDNNLFVFERHVYSEEFLKFINHILEVIKNLSNQTESDATEDSVSVTSHTKLNDVMTGFISKIVTKLLLDLGSRNLSSSSILGGTNDNNIFINQLAAKLMQVYQSNELICEAFVQNILLQEGNNIIKCLLKCKNDATRKSVSRLLSTIITTVLRNAPEFDPEDQQFLQTHSTLNNIILFLNISAASVNNDCAQCWTKFGPFFQMLNQFGLKGGISVIKFFYSKNFITQLLDFYLEKESPLKKKGERRYSMGNKILNPEFGDLVELVSYLIRFSNPLLKADVPEEENQPQEEEIHNYNEITKLGRKQDVFILSETDKTCAFSSEFLIKTLRDGHNSMALSFAVAHLAFQNYQYSKTVVYLLLEGINESQYSELNPYFNVLRNLILIKDNLQSQRIEWLLGYSQIINSTMEGKTKYGIGQISNSLSEDIFSYKSPLLYNHLQSDALLLLLWRLRKKTENHTISSLKFLFSLVDECSCLFGIISKAAPPTYKFARYTDWIIPFLNSYLDQMKRFPSSHSMSTKREELAVETLSLMLSYETKLAAKVKIEKEEELEQLEETEKIREIERSKKDEEKEGEEKIISEDKNEEGMEEEEKVREIGKNEKLDNLIIMPVPAPYLIGETDSEETLTVEEKEPIILTVSQIFTQVIPSHPTSTTNLSIPKDFLRLRYSTPIIITTNSIEDWRGIEFAMRIT
jgi:hypothetical protein